MEDTFALSPGAGLTRLRARRTYICPECERVLGVAEVIEGFCQHCGPVAPREVLR